MEYLVRVAETGSFVAAARDFDVSPPAVTQMIAAFERELGVELLRRNSRHVSLTTDGEVFLPICAQALSDLQGAVGQLSVNRAHASGKLVVGMARIFGQNIAPFLADFIARHRGIALDLRVVGNPGAPLAKLVDVLVFVGWPDDSDMIAKRIAQTKFSTLAAPSYWKSRGVPRDPDELRLHDCLAFRTPWGVLLDVWKYRRGEDVRDVSVKPSVVSDDRDWLIAAGIRGAGVIRVADLFLGPLMEQGALEPVLVDWEALEAPPVYIMYRRRAPKRVRLFVDFMTDLFANLETSRAGGTRLSPVPMPPHFRGKWTGPLSRRAKRGAPD